MKDMLTIYAIGVCPSSVEKQNFIMKMPPETRVDPSVSLYINI